VTIVPKNNLLRSKLKMIVNYIGENAIIETTSELGEINTDGNLLGQFSNLGHIYNLQGRSHMITSQYS